MIREQTIRARQKLLSQLPVTGELLRGTLLERVVRHTKDCPKCARGEGHRVFVLTVSYPGRRTRHFRAKYESLVIRRGYKKTIIALAHKLIRTIYVILARRKPYRDSTFNYEAASVAKNAPRWIRALKKYGYWPQLAPAT